ncbi:ATP-binding protein [Vasconcelosia minhoensis]|nr:ATP-binding protein [Romeria gracilis]
MQFKSPFSRMLQAKTKSALSETRPSRSSPLGRQLPLRSILVVPFLLQISAAVGLTGYFSLRNGRTAVNDLAAQLIARTDQLVDQQLVSYLSLPPKVNQLNADLLQRRIVEPDDADTLSSLFWKEAKTYGQLDYIALTLPNGKYIGAGDWLSEPGIEIDIVAADGVGRTYSVDSQGQRQAIIDQYEYFPKAEPFYYQTVEAQKPMWTLVLEQFDTLAQNDPVYIAANANLPVYNSANQLLGVLSVDLRLSNISDFLANLELSQNSQVFIMQRNGDLVASSNGQPLYQSVNGEPQRLNALDSTDSLTQATTRALQERFDLQNIEQEQSLILPLQGQRRYLHIRPWRDADGLDWLVVTVVPESDFMAQIQANTRTTILLCLGALAIASVLGLYTSHWIVQSVWQLDRAARAISRGDLNQQVQKSSIQEFSSLGQTFNQMAKQLQESFETLEERVEERTQTLSNTLVELQQAQTQLIQTEKMSSLGQLVAGVAHEINNPISFIYGNLEPAKEYAQDLILLLQHYQSECPQPSPVIQAFIQEIDLVYLQSDFLKVLNSMELGAERITEIVRSLKIFSRQDESDVKTVDIHEGIDSTLLILSSQLKAQNWRPAIEVIQDYGDLPPVSCYPGQLNQVFMNILANAIDAIDESLERAGPIAVPQITIRTQATLNQAIIRIADNGLGIPENVRVKLFDPFFTTKPVGKGTGLGLSISYQIITERHGGQLTCWSKPGQGTEFAIAIPLTLPTR